MGSGRGPTRLISPFSTLNNCGNSSMLVLRKDAAKRRDTRIVFDLENRPCDFVQMFDFFHALFRIDHHGAEFVDTEMPFVQAQALLHEDRAGPREVSLMSTAVSNKRGRSRMINPSEMPISTTRLNTTGQPSRPPV